MDNFTGTGCHLLAKKLAQKIFSFFSEIFEISELSLIRTCLGGHIPMYHPPMISFFRQTASELTGYVQAQHTLPFTYPAIGHTRDGLMPVKGYDNDINRIHLGHGLAVFEAAKQSVRQWKMFPEPWTFIYPDTAPIVPGTTVAMCARVFGLWWRNACSIVYTIDEPHRFGFAYGTLPGHVERGEELFLIEVDDREDVWYHIRAFSRPRHWVARLGYPFVRRYQRKFARDSKKYFLQSLEKR